jgi:hypothetical protein
LIFCGLFNFSFFNSDILRRLGFNDGLHRLVTERKQQESPASIEVFIFSLRCGVCYRKKFNSRLRLCMFEVTGKAIRATGRGGP